MATRADPASPRASNAPLARSRDAAALLARRDWSGEHERLVAVLLDEEMRPIRTVQVGEGDVTGTPLFARRLLGLALAGDARGLILAHNHPSGCSRPSGADRRVTGELARLLAAVDIVLIDHLIRGDEWLSMRDEGML